MLLQELRVDDPIHGDIQEIQSAVERAAELTRQLLAFSRQQVLQLSVIDLRDVVRTTERMLRRLIGEDVTLTTELAEEHCLVLADAGQLEQVIVNVVLNARDAMPTGGSLQISVSNEVVDAAAAAAARALGEVSPGSYAVLAVRDTGEGMDDATRSRIFDPFFTTKEVGKGTGLGLATVYGIVSQSGGYITVDSERGNGTTFRIFLPLTDEEQLHPDGARRHARHGGGDGATVLLVEDEPALRKITERVLVKHGFRVLSAANGAEAMSLAATLEPIHCVLSDVVMPTMSGQQLLARLEELRGPLPAIFMSGYALEAVEKHGALPPGAPLLRKPVKPSELVEAVGRIVARSESPERA
jgi:CheY-like chemotaxis protein/two-component sensor histidine kinase